MLDQLNIPWPYVISVATTVLGYLLAFLLIPRILLTRREAGASLAWILVILFLPYLGALSFFVFGRTRVRRKTRKKERYTNAFQRKMNRLPESCNLAESNKKNKLLPGLSMPVAQLVNSISGTSPLTGNAVEVFIETEAAYKQMEDAILAARHHVHFMSYIFREDQAGKRFQKLLIQKAEEGIEVKLLVDGFGAQGLGSSFVKPMIKAGVKFAKFSPVFVLSIHWRPTLRNHRKILICDGTVGFAGGMNIGDEYQGRKKRFAPWRDTHLRVEGPAARQLQVIFSEDWFFATDEDLAEAEYFPDSPAVGNSVVQVVDSGPDKEHAAIHSVFFTAVTEATDRIYITTPYFVPDGAMLLALKSAAWRGLDVRILLPGRSDQRTAKLAARSYYQELIEAGVKIYEHRPGILHAKTMVVDGVWSTVGSANMDIRSFRLNYEVNVLVAGARFAGKMEKIFLQDVYRARLMTTRLLEEKSPAQRLAEGLARIFSPVL
jgi:cardiolipin synthase A/B